MAKSRKTHGNASARAYTGAEIAEIAADQAEQSSRIAGQWGFSLSREDPQDDVENAVILRRPFWAFIEVGCEE
jgi:hypothetical protein